MGSAPGQIYDVCRSLFMSRPLSTPRAQRYSLVLLVTFGIMTTASCNWLVTEETVTKQVESSSTVQNQVSVRESGSTTLRNVGLLVAGAVAIGLATWRSVAADRQSKATMRQSDTASGDLWNARFQKGVEMIASEHEAVRLGGVYALWHLFADSSKPNRIQLIETLCAFARQPPGESNPSYGLREDVQAVLDVFKLESSADEPSPKELSEKLAYLVQHGIGQEDQLFAAIDPPFKAESQVEYPRNLRSCNLDGGRLFQTNLAYSTLRDASLKGVTVWAADLSGAILRGADLSSPYAVKGQEFPRIIREYNEGTYDVTQVIDTRLRGANMIGTRLVGSWIQMSDLSDAILWNADFSRSNIRQTGLSNANLAGANLSGASFERTDFSGAKLQGTNLSGTDFGGNRAPSIGLVQAQLDEAIAEKNNPPNLDGVVDSQTGESLFWRGRNIEDFKANESYLDSDS